MNIDQIIATLPQDARRHGLQHALDQIEWLRNKPAAAGLYGPPLTPEERSKLTIAEADLRKRYGGRR